MKNPDTPDSDPPGAAGETQQVNIEDVDLDALPEAGPIKPRLTPPPLPPTHSMTPSFQPGDPRASQPPLSAGPPYSMPQPPEAPRRGPMFFIGLLVAVLVVGALAGTALSVFRRPPPAPAATPGAGSVKGPAVITIPTVDMDDPDGGP